MCITFMNRTTTKELEVRLTCDLAKFYLRYAGNLRKADKLLKQGLKLHHEVFGFEHIDTAKTLNAMGVLSAQRGCFKKAFVRVFFSSSALSSFPVSSVRADADHLSGVVHVISEV